MATRDPLLPRRTRKSAQADPALSLVLQNDIAELTRVAEAVESFSRRHRLPDRLTANFVLVLDEIITNVVSHAYPMGAAGEIALAVRLADGMLLAEVIDGGIPFDPTSAPAPDLDAPLEDRRIGGLGVHFVRKLTDRFEYRREGDRNHVTIAKAIA